ncbi:MAG TPA: M81 family metallopeptidase [Acidimicrobiia bacterium]|nr:M81 family metallopeptidase [Acidimicrobiia bacterium]
MRIAYAEISNESCTFSPLRADLNAFHQDHYHVGDEVPVAARGAHTLGGFLQAVEESGHDIEAVPLLQARARPNGRITAGTIKLLSDQITSLLSQAGPIDGLMLSLHGASTAEGIDDVEGRLLSLVREIVGERVPIVTPLDHHANLTAAMVRHATLLIGDRTQPHSPFHRGVLAGEMLFDLVAGRERPVAGWHKIPMVAPQDHFRTASPPMSRWFERAREMEQRPGVVSVSTFPMQPWLDVEEAGWATLVYVEPWLGEAAATELSAELADLAWGMRAEFWRSDRLPVDQGVAAAIAEPGGLVVFSDTGDCVHAGSPGDSTALLAGLLARELDGDAYLFIVDPATVDAAHDAGIGATIERAVGGWSGAPSGGPLQIGARVVGLSEGVRVRTAEHGFSDIGRTALLEVGHIKLVVCSIRSIAMLYPVLYQHLGLAIEDAKMLMLKTGSNFQYYERWTRRLIRLDSPGPSQSDLTGLPWQRAPRPLYPLDPDFEWVPAG